MARRLLANYQKESVGHKKARQYSVAGLLLTGLAKNSSSRLSGRLKHFPHHIVQDAAMLEVDRLIGGINP